MKTTNRLNILLIIVAAIVVTAFVIRNNSARKGNEPWTKQQLMEPATLANILNHPKEAQPLIYCVGPMAVIKNSIFTGPASEKDNLDKLKEKLSKVPKDANIVIYCGCCPFSRCPNIRPAFRLLNEMGFKNQKLLNIPHNIKVDWIDHGYPSNH